MTDNLPPYSQKAERAAIGSVIINSSLIDSVELEAGDFYVERHRAIWNAVRSIARNGNPVDFVTLTDQLDSHGELEAVGGPAYLTRLVNNTPSTLGLEGYARIIQEKAFRRRMLRVANSLAAAAHNGSDPEEMTAAAICDLAAGNRPRNASHRIGDLMSELYDLVEERSKNPQDVWGIPSGFVDFDHLTGGFHAQEMTFIFGEPGSRKSMWCQAVAENVALGGIGVGFFTIEMGALQLATRIASSISDVPSRRLKTGRLETGDWEDINRMMEKTADIPLYINDTSALTTTQLRSEVARLIASRLDLKLIIVDYLLLMGDRAENDTELSEKCSKLIKGIAKDFKVSALTINSMVKSGWGSNPNKADMRGSGQVAHDADVLAVMIADDDAGEVTMRFEKVKNEPVTHSIRFVTRQGIPTLKTATQQEVDVSRMPGGNGQERQRGFEYEDHTR